MTSSLLYISLPIGGGLSQAYALVNRTVNTEKKEQPRLHGPRTWVGEADVDALCDRLPHQLLRPGGGGGAGTGSGSSSAGHDGGKRAACGDVEGQGGSGPRYEHFISSPAFSFVDHVDFSTHSGIRAGTRRKCNSSAQVPEPPPSSDPQTHRPTAEFLGSQPTSAQVPEPPPPSDPRTHRPTVEFPMPRRDPKSLNP